MRKPREERQAAIGNMFTGTHVMKVIEAVKEEQAKNETYPFKPKSGWRVGTFIHNTKMKTTVMENDNKREVVTSQDKSTKNIQLEKYSMSMITVDRAKVFIHMAGNKTATLLFNYIEFNFIGSICSVKLSVPKIAKQYNLTTEEITQGIKDLTDFNVIKRYISKGYEDVYFVNYSVMAQGNIAENKYIEKEFIKLDKEAVRIHRAMQDIPNDDILMQAINELKEEKFSLVVTSEDTERA